MVENDQAWRFIDADFGDGTYRFGLRYEDVCELEKLRGNVGPLVILTRLAGQFSAEDLRETLRLALIGGGMPPTQALHLVRTYVEGRPLLENLSLAYRVLAIAVNGPTPPEADNSADSAETGNGAPKAS